MPQKKTSKTHTFENKRTHFGKKVCKHVKQYLQDLKGLHCKGGLKLLPRDVQVRKKGRRRRAQPVTNIHQMDVKEILEREEKDGEIKSSIQAQEVDIQGGADGEKKENPQSLGHETHGCMQE